MKYLFTFFLFSFLIFSAHATVWVVDSLNNAGYGSLRAAIDSASSGDTVRFSPLLIVNGSDSIVLDSSLIFSKSITIKGVYNATDTLYISGQDTDRIFTVENTTNLYLDSLVAWKGIFNGGVISFKDSDSLFITNCIFTKCVQNGRNGGVVYLDGLNGDMYLKVDHCEMVENSANKGGAIFGITRYKMQIDVLNSNLSSNSASYGGGIQIDNQPNLACSTLINIENSSINGNGGAGLNVKGVSNANYTNQTSLINIINSEFSGNYKGGVQVNLRSTGTVSNCTSTLVIDNSIIRNNTLGAGVRNYVYAVLGGSSAIANLTVLSSTIDSNGTTFNTSNSGGLMNVAGIQQITGVATSNVLIENSTISNNISSGDGGGLRSTVMSYSSAYDANCESFVNIKRSTFFNNSASNAGAIKTHSQSNSNTLVPISILNIENTTIYGNTSLVTGALVCSMTSGIPSLFPATTVNLIGSIFAENTTPQITTYNGNITSSSYNVYSGHPTGTSLTDFVNVSANSLNLSSLGFNGGVTKTLVPLFPSVAINTGNPLDFSSAQNGTLNGIRDIGAAETCSHSIIDYIIACDSLTWINGITYYSSNTTAVDSFQTVAGCDSIVRLNLTINYTSNLIDTIVACDSLTWLNGVTYFTSISGVIDTLISITGCDSIVTLDLTIHTIDNSVIQSVDTIWSTEMGAVYQWYDCATQMPISGETQRQFISLVSGIYAVEISKNGCVDTSICTTVNVCDSYANFINTNTTNGNYSFTNTSTGNYTNTHWAFGDGSTDTTTNSPHTYLANGTYVVVLAIHDSIVVGDSCISYYSDTINVTGVTNPTQCNAGWAVLSDSNTGGVTIINSSTGTNLSYHWDFGDGDTSNIQFPSHTYASNGSFDLCLTVDDGIGCVDTYCDSISSNGVVFKNGFELNVVATYPLGIGNIIGESSVNIFPNPTSHQLNIKTQNFKITKIQIRDNSGKVVRTVTSNFEIVNVESLATGVYHLELIGEEETVSKKFIKQ